MTTTRAQPPLSPARPDHSRNRPSSSFSSPSSSSISTASSATSSPSPSPRTSVPFSWEHHPGIPKNNCRRGVSTDQTVYSQPTPLPLPPPLRAPSSRRRSSRPPPANDPAADPFAAALAECTREQAGVMDMDALFPPTPASIATAGRAGSRRWSLAAGGVVGLLDLYGCKSAMAVAEGAFVVRRPVVAVARARPGRADQGWAGRR